MQSVLDRLSDLPVSKILPDIARHVETGAIAIVNSEPASGKTLLVPSMLTTASGEQFFVIQPRRFLAINAAETLAELSETELGETIGYAVGNRLQEAESVYDLDTNRLVFLTYGFALASMVILDAENIVLDEIHEDTLDMAIVKALLKRRLQGHGKPLKRLVLMSATMDCAAESAYWEGFHPQVFHTKSASNFRCEKIWLSEHNPAQGAIQALKAGATGILVFVAGMKEIDRTSQDLEARLQLAQCRETVELAWVHGSSNRDERYRALAAPAPGMAKILIGTNVLESGMNLPWVNAGVSSGEHRTMEVVRETGAVGLLTQPLAQSNLDQQAGRTNRFGHSTFYLCHALAHTDRLPMPIPEIRRLPLTELYLHGAKTKVDPKILEFNPQPDRLELLRAERTLQRFGFLTEDLKLTEDGERASRMPVSLETAAMLCHALKINIGPAAIVLAGVMEANGLRHERQRHHGIDRGSDFFDAACAYVLGMQFQSLPRQRRFEAMEQYNINYRRLMVAHETVLNVQRSLNLQADHAAFLPGAPRPLRETLTELRQCLLAAAVNAIGCWDTDGFIYNNGNRGVRFQPDKASVVRRPREASPVYARLRQVTGRSGQMFTIAESLTLFRWEDFDTFNRQRPGVFGYEKAAFSHTLTVFGKEFCKHLFAGVTTAAAQTIKPVATPPPVVLRSGFSRSSSRTVSRS